MDNLLINIGNLIKEGRKSKCYSTQELAKKLSVSSGFINNLENGKTDSFNLHLLNNLCSILDISPINFVSDDVNFVDKLNILENIKSELLDDLNKIIESYVQAAYNVNLSQNKVNLLTKKILSEINYFNEVNEIIRK